MHSRKTQHAIETFVSTRSIDEMVTAYEKDIKESDDAVLANSDAEKIILEIYDIIETLPDQTKQEEDSDEQEDNGMSYKKF